MTKQTINLGTAPAGSDGDTTRSGFTKVNSNFDEIYARAQGKLAKDVSGAGTVALTAAEALNGIIELSGALTGNRVVTVPASTTQAYIVRNNTSGAFVLTFATAGGSGVTVTAGAAPKLVISDGTNIVEIVSDGGGPSNIQVLTSSGTFTPAAGTKRIIVEVQGAGGASAGLPAGNPGVTMAVGGAGGGGGFVRSVLTSGFSGVPYTVGAGGVGVVAASGGAGCWSTFGPFTAGGGGGGSTQATASITPVTGYGGAGGGASGGNMLSQPGNPGLPSMAVNTAGIFTGIGGASAMGSGGAGALNGNSNPGGGAGGGGGGSWSSNTPAYRGGDGAPGRIIVYEYLR